MASVEGLLNARYLDRKSTAAFLLPGRSFTWKWYCKVCTLSRKSRGFTTSDGALFPRGLVRVGWSVTMVRFGHPSRNTLALRL
ncbi:hypothetical protein E2C01_057208 [Portunus trituberculatus]|uniref:Uncharacterized protein n=1 Tax=Portunus trituberculatus TaxID=210409 RepID=A0A5B7H2Q6_PORTR|nr:hypothetical protein [Portunus trituberculatus]